MPSVNTRSELTAITIRGLTKRFGTFTALHEVDLTIEPGMYGLLGPNGAGKTTLMRILATIMEPTEGQIAIGNLTLPRDKEPVRRLLGYLPQEFGLYRRMTGRDFLDYVAVLRGIADARERRRRVEEVLELVNMSDAASRRIRGYSGGMRQRIGIAQALIGDPRLLIVDEPTAGLDPEERIRFRNLLAELAADRVILLSTHIVGDIAESCRRLAVLNGGRVAYEGTLSALLERTRGTVWRVEASETERREFERHYRVVQASVDGSGFRLRIVSPENPGGRGVPEEPTLEDAYVSLVAGGVR